MARLIAVASALLSEFFNDSGLHSDAARRTSTLSSSRAPFGRKTAHASPKSAGSGRPFKAHASNSAKVSAPAGVAAHARAGRPSGPGAATRARQRAAAIAEQPGGEAGSPAKGRERRRAHDAPSDGSAARCAKTAPH